ncbi:hypothetical protein OKC48_16240 [Methylorubrum extorquens]|uniref:hypothetical protein n=1 Tax=Methylorubrum extorquens TaxID=408 RepID=UPI0022380F22|nr:hypothetical protein [Methylorubrum extorquens]UYW24823.1 hypothetical protein OKC48_16240 [Methylorubrum extorquens]
MAGRAPAAAVVGAPDQRDGEPAPRIELDALTPAVIEARAIVAEFDAGFLYRGREPAHPVEELAVWGKRASAGAGLGSRLIIATHDRFARHPLREEALVLRARLFAFYEEAKRELPRATRRANGIYG